MALYLREADLQPLLSYADAIELVEAAMISHARGQASNRPRQRVRAGKTGLNVLLAANEASGYLGFKVLAAGAGAARQLVWLYTADDGRLVALLEANWLSLARTSAASAVATHKLARQDASVAAFIGAGRQQGGQLPAVCLVRAFEDVRVFSPTGVSAEELSKRAREQGLPARVCKTAEEAADGADVITVATHGDAIALEGRWLKPGAHVNAMGVNRGAQREIDDDAVLRAEVVAVDEKENARLEAGDLLPAIAAGKLSWDRVHDLGAILAGLAPGRSSSGGITLFESQGIGLEDIAVASVAYDRAKAAGVGQELNIA